MEPANEYLNSAQAAEYLHLSDRAVRSLCKSQQIKHQLLNGRNYRFKKEWLDEYLQSITIEPIKEENNERS